MPASVNASEALPANFCQIYFSPLAKMFIPENATLPIKFKIQLFLIKYVGKYSSDQAKANRRKILLAFQQQQPQREATKSQNIQIISTTAAVFCCCCYYYYCCCYCCCCYRYYFCCCSLLLLRRTLNSFIKIHTGEKSLLVPFINKPSPLNIKIPIEPFSI